MLAELSTLFRMLLANRIRTILWSRYSELSVSVRVSVSLPERQRSNDITFDLHMVVKLVQLDTI